MRFDAWLCALHTTNTTSPQSASAYDVFVSHFSVRFHSYKQLFVREHIHFHLLEWLEWVSAFVDSSDVDSGHNKTGQTGWICWSGVATTNLLNWGLYAVSLCSYVHLWQGFDWMIYDVSQINQVKHFMWSQLSNQRPLFLNSRDIGVSLITN